MTTPGSPVGPPACEGYQAVATDGGYFHVARVHCPGCAESASLREQLATSGARIIELERLLDVKRQADKPRYCKNCPFAEFLHPTPYGCVVEADDAPKPGEPS